MMSEPSHGTPTLGVIGAGIMGRGIAQVAAEAGIPVVLADMRPEAVAEAIAFCADMIRRKAARGSLSEQDAEAAVGRIRAAAADAGSPYGAFASCDVVIEAVVERLDVKRQLVEDLE